jgi:endoglucanase
LRIWFAKVILRAPIVEDAKHQMKNTTTLPAIKLFVLARVMAVALALAVGGVAVQAATNEASLPLQLHTEGNRILNSKGETVWLRGVNAASMEFTSDGEGHILNTVNTAIRDWHVNIIRLPLAQDRWFGKAREQTNGSDAYRALVHQVVDACASQGCYIILDLHWSDCNEWGTNIGQHSMPDLNSVAFWKDFAPVYANSPAVLFDLYNEPHDVTWDEWLKGGRIKDTPNGRRAGPGKTYDAVGMQQMLDTVRATGAKNVVVAGGLDWAYDFSGILEGRQLSDPTGHGVIYANHCYDNKKDSVDAWIAKMEKASAKLPVIVTEFGGMSGPSRQVHWDNWLLHVLQAIDDHQWSFTAWDLHPSAGPTLITRGWSYTPTPRFGVFVKQSLAGTLPKYTEPPPPPMTNSAGQGTNN